jgi:hypothetical protein
LLGTCVAATIFAMADEQLGETRLQKIGVDWWATIVAGAIVLLAVADVLPRIPW